MPLQGIEESTYKTDNSRPDPNATPKSGRLEPLGCFTNTPWTEVEQTIKERIKEKGQYNIPFVYDGEPGLDDFLANIAESQRGTCLPGGQTGHGPRGLYHALLRRWNKEEGESTGNRYNQTVDRHRAT